MPKVIKEIPAKSSLLVEKMNEISDATYYYAEHREPWKIAYAAYVNPHDFYPTPTFLGYYDCVEDAEKALSFYEEYGGYIEQTTYGQLNSIMFLNKNKGKYYEKSKILYR